MALSLTGNREDVYPLCGCIDPIIIKESEQVRINGDYYITIDICKDSKVICSNIQYPLLNGEASIDIPTLFKGLKKLKTNYLDITNLSQSYPESLVEYEIKITGYWNESDTCDRQSETLNPYKFTVLNYCDESGEDTLKGKDGLLLTSNHEKYICIDCPIPIGYYSNKNNVEITAYSNGQEFAKISKSHSDQVSDSILTKFAEWDSYKTNIPTNDIITFNVKIGSYEDTLIYTVDPKCCDCRTPIYYLNNCGMNDFILARCPIIGTIEIGAIEVCKVIDCGTGVGGSEVAERNKNKKSENVIIEVIDSDHIEEFLMSTKKYIYIDDKPIQIKNADGSYVIYRRNSVNYIDYKYFRTIERNVLTQ